jgi:hypothetical protein
MPSKGSAHATRKEPQNLGRVYKTVKTKLQGRNPPAAAYDRHHQLLQAEVKSSRDLKLKLECPPAFWMSFKSAKGVF